MGKVVTGGESSSEGMVGDSSDISAEVSVLISSSAYMKPRACQLSIWADVGGCCVSISIDVLSVGERIQEDRAVVGNQHYLYLSDPF